MENVGTALAFIASAVAGGVAWDVLKFPLIKALHIATGHNIENDISGYWLGHANSQTGSEYAAIELLHLQKAGSKLKGKLYQLTTDSRFYVYSITGYMRGNYVSICYQISGKGIQTGVFSLVLVNQKSYHFGALSGVYTEYYDIKKKHKSSAYRFESIENAEVNITPLKKFQLWMPWRQRKIVSNLVAGAIK